METLLENIPKIYSIQEYLAYEEKADSKHNFFNGKIIEMPGAKYQHNLIATNLTTALNIALDAESTDYFVLNSDMKIFIPKTVTFVYPDAVVICEAPLFYNNRKDVITNPLLIVEVLSQSTRDYDQQGKFAAYKQISSFKEYVLVEQDFQSVTASFKEAENTWVDSLAEGVDSSIYLKSIACAISLKKIYKGVKF